MIYAYNLLSLILFYVFRSETIGLIKSFEIHFDIGSGKKTNLTKRAQNVGC